METEKWSLFKQSLWIDDGLIKTMILAKFEWPNPSRARQLFTIILLVMLLMLSCRYQPDEEKIVLPEMATDAIISIAAFNIQVFGKSKMGKIGVPEILANIIRRYDVILIQEIRDISETSIFELLDLVNSSNNAEYALLLSDRLGRTSSKEQYAYFYRKNLLAVIDAYHYDDGLEPDEDTFQREPFLARFQVVSQSLNFSLIGIHVAPDDVQAEVDGLVDVFENMQARWQETDVLLLGDFNADCSYLSDSERLDIRLWQDPKFVWWIDDNADTTTKSTDCAYDRIVSHTDLDIEPQSREVLWEQEGNIVLLGVFFEIFAI